MKDDEPGALSDTSLVSAIADVSNKNTYHEIRSSIQLTKGNRISHICLYPNRSSLFCIDIKEKLQIL